MNDAIKLDELAKEYLDLLRDNGFDSAADFYEKKDIPIDQIKSEIKRLEKEIEKYKNK